MWSIVARRALVIGAIFLLTSSGFASAAPAGAEVVVARLYKDFGWQAFAIQNELFENGVAQQGKDVLGRYFDPELARLIRDDAACQSKERGICRLDFDILFDSQDPVVTDLELSLLAAGRVQVRFKNPVSGEATTIEYRLARGRIVDVLYGPQGARSLKRILRGTD
ncbi:DUF3828 domain-containing protein [Pseudoduganella sp. OTU4001]|uniref:DUF3828 domain-containing protein n=1 Tax=Pseudoduganella sp. OTU4001 TaxID=3043854 RepID=UPI00313B229D